MMLNFTINRKCQTIFSARWTPSFATFHDSTYMSWIDNENGDIRIAQTLDMKEFNQKITLNELSTTPTALVAGKPGLLLAWVHPRTQQVCLALSADGLEWGKRISLKIRTTSRPSLAYFQNRYWLLVLGSDDNRLHLVNTTDGLEWRNAGVFKGQKKALPFLMVHQNQLAVTWNDLESSVIYIGLVRQQLKQPIVVYSEPIGNYSLSVFDDQLYLSWMDEKEGKIRAMCQEPGAKWADRFALHERCKGFPIITSLRKKLFIVWVRNDSVGKIHFAPEGDKDGYETFVFTGDLQGHPTALDPNHQTPYPYLALLVLPSDMSMPKGQSEASLTADLNAILDVSKSFWKEASFKKVEITHEVHPHVVNLPKSMNEYFIRKRPKIIDGSGVAFPVAFQGGETLEIEGSNNYQVIVTFSQATLSRQEIADLINNSIEATVFNGPAEEKPLASKSDLDQLRIQTADLVDPGTTLNIKGGTAVDLLGLGPNDRTVYEGSKIQTNETNHLDVMLRDAMKAVADTKPDPAAYLRQFYGVVISIASNLGWCTLRACANWPGPIEIFENQNPFMVASLFITPIYPPEVFAHEIGHTLALPDFYQEGWRIVGAEPGDWDIMDTNQLNHPTAWIKAYGSSPQNSKARWMAGEDIVVLDSTKGSVEVLILPNESAFPTSNPFSNSHPGVPICHAIKIELDKNHSFYVENRQKGPYQNSDLGAVAYNLSIPGSGLLITDTVDDVGTTQLPRSNVVLVHPKGLHVAEIPDSIIDEVLKATTEADKRFILNPYVPSEIPKGVEDEIVKAKDRKDIEYYINRYRDSQIRAFYPVDNPGEEVVLYEFPDGEGDIRVKILEVIGNAKPYVYKVRATWGRLGSWFDLMINKWVAPPWESTDIWIDSEENGWDVYEHNDAGLNPNVAGNPVENGDRPWVGHENIVYARIWNKGDIAQNNVRVDFETVSPPGMSVGYPFDTDYIDIPAGGSAIAKGKWIPLNIPEDEHACITAKVEYRPWDVDKDIIGELNANNNSAQENISDFYLGKGSPYGKVAFPFEFANPYSEKVDMKLFARGLKPGWKLLVSPYRFSLEPGERIEGDAILQADDSVPIEDPEEGNPAPIFSLEALASIGCTWLPIGGVSMVAHPVYKSMLDVKLDVSGSGVYVSIHASTNAGPIISANVAARLIGPGKETIETTRGVTDGQGNASLYLPIRWENYPNVPIFVEARLSPTAKTGPSNKVISIPR